MKNRNEHLFAKSSKTSFIGRLYRKERFNFYSNNNEKCEIEDYLPFPLDERLKNLIFIMSEFNLKSAFGFLRNYFTREIFYASENLLLELSNVFYYREKLNQDKKRVLLSWSFRIFETGLQKQIGRKISNRFFLSDRSRIKIYRNKKDLIDRFTKFKNVNLNYFENMFPIGFVFYVIVIFLYKIDTFFFKSNHYNFKNPIYLWKKLIQNIK